MQIVLLTASVRKESLNKKLANVVSELLKQRSITLAELEREDLLLPLYDGDLEDSQGLPERAKHVVERLQQSNALIIITPEYNYSVPGTLKNMIDWISRARPIMPFANLPVLLLSASPSLAGGSRGLLQVRIPLEICGAHVFPASFSLAQADQAFDLANKLKDLSFLQQLEKLIGRFLKFVEKLAV